MTRTLTRAFVFVALIAVTLACSDSFPQEFPAEDFTLKSPVTGKEVSLYGLKGKPVIVYWFVSW